MNNFILKLNNNDDQIKTLNELIKESFDNKKKVVDLSFFYKDDEDRKDVKDIFKNTKSLEFC